jgi:hypothetical protein
MLASEPDNYADSLTWDTPTLPHENALAVVGKKSVILVRHFFADSGNVDKIYHDYLSEKISQSGM